MADYTRQISASTTLMIRDTGGNVEFWVKTGSSTWNNDQQWSFFANGSDSGVRKIRMVAGGNWQMFGAVYVSYDQDVRFSIYGAGIGFPSYDFWQHIGRSTVPQNPVIIDVHPISSSYIHVQFVGQHDGGSPILEWQLGFGGNSNGPSAYWASSGISDVGPFSSGERVYFWARGRNALGWSAWSNRGEAITWRVPDAPSVVSFLDVDQKTVRTKFTDRGDGGQPILERELGYGKNSVAPTSTMSASGSGIDDVIDLDPGKLYYFWVRSRNSVGWGAWSERSEVLLIAGARIMVGIEWKRAVPYVRVAGVWRMARPWVRIDGTWKETSL